MGKRVIEMELSTSSISAAIKELEAYKKELLAKTELFVKKLADLGVDVAEHNGGEYGSLLMFKAELNPDKYGCTSFVIGESKDYIVREWRSRETPGGWKTALVDPLLMAEFGSGFKAENPLGVDGVGQGTFPDQKHAFDEAGWYWKTRDGIVHHSTGESPSHPMFSASVEIMNKVNQVAKEVFG